MVVGCKGKEWGIRSEEEGGSEQRETGQQRMAKGAGGIRSFPITVTMAAKSNNPRERNLVQQERGPIFYPGPTDEIGGSQHVVESTYPHPNALTEVVVETQLTTSARAKNHICNAIVANIGFDSPIPIPRRGGEGRNIGYDAHMEAHVINTPSSLMTLGKVIGTPRHGKTWEPRNKSPLGGYL